MKEREKPQVVSSLVSLPFLSNSLFGWMLLACLWMPLGIGCDKKTILVPAENPLPGAIVVQWPYLYGACLGTLLTVIAVVRPRNLGAWLVPFPFVCLSLLMVMGLYVAYAVNEPQDKLVMAAMLTVPPFLVLLWAAWPLRLGDRLLSASRGLCGLGVVATWTIYVNSMFCFVSRFLYGFYVAVVASIGLTVSAWFLYSRGERALSDCKAPHRPVQFRIRTLMMWTLFVAVASAIYQRSAN